MNNMTSPPTASSNGDLGRDFPMKVIFLILPILKVILRFLGRRVERVSWWWDDWIILISVSLFAASWGVDFQTSQYQATDSRRFLLLVYIQNILHPLITGSTKISGLLLYILHFGYKPRHARPAYVLIGLVSTWILTVLLATIFQCRPISAAWNAPSASSNSNASCISRHTLFQASSISEATLNFLILIFTIPGSYSIDWVPFVPRGLVLTLTYLIGIFVIAVSILCAYYAPSYASPTDALTTFSAFLLWSKLQEGFGIAAVCLWPASPGLLALLTCNFRDPKSREYVQKKQRRQIRKRGYGALLSDSVERMATEGSAGRGAVVWKDERPAFRGAESDSSLKLARLKAELDAEAERKYRTGPGTSDPSHLPMGISIQNRRADGMF